MQRGRIRQRDGRVEITREDDRHRLVQDLHLLLQVRDRLLERRELTRRDRLLTASGRRRIERDCESGDEEHDQEPLHGEPFARARTPLPR